MNNTPDTMFAPIRESEIDETGFFMSLWLLDRAQAFPQAFKLLPTGAPRPAEPGEWVTYPYDDQLQIWINSSHGEGLEFFREYKIKQREEIMSTALTVVEKQTVLKLLTNNMKAVASVVPKHLTPERLMRVAYQAICKTPKLAQCNQLSLVNAIIEASQLGLEISGPLGQASLIPFKSEVVLIVEYKGKIALAHNSGQVKSFSAHPVYEKDQWDYEYGLAPFLRHKPYDGDDGRGNLVAAYAVVQYLNGGADFEVVNKKNAMRAKAASAAKNKADSPWNQEANEWTMWVKTAVHQLSKRVPQSPELQRANTLDDMAEIGKQDINHIVDIDLESLPQEPETTEVPQATEPPPTEDQKIIKNLMATKDAFPNEYVIACDRLDLDVNINPTILEATSIMTEISSIIDTQTAQREATA